VRRQTGKPQGSGLPTIGVVLCRQRNEPKWPDPLPRPCWPRSGCDCIRQDQDRQPHQGGRGLRFLGVPQPNVRVLEAARAVTTCWIGRRTGPWPPSGAKVRAMPTALRRIGRWERHRGSAQPRSAGNGQGTSDMKLIEGSRHSEQLPSTSAWRSWPATVRASRAQLRPPGSTTGGSRASGSTG